MKLRHLRHLWQLTVFLTLLSLSGCTTAKLIYRDPDLTREELQQGLIGIGAVTALGGGEYFLADELAAAVTICLTNARPWLKVVELPKLREAFPLGEYGRLMSNVVASGYWPESAMATFQFVTNQVRYVLIIDVIEGEWDQKDTWYGPHRQEYHYRYREHGPGVIMSYRGGWAQILYMIYDLQRGKTVWVATGKSSATDSSYQSSYRHRRSRHLEMPYMPAFVPIATDVGPRISKFLPR